jgi:hypothetical protein
MRLLEMKASKEKRLEFEAFSAEVTPNQLKLYLAVNRVYRPVLLYKPEE